MIHLENISLDFQLTGDGRIGVVLLLAPSQKTFEHFARFCFFGIDLDLIPVPFDLLHPDPTRVPTHKQETLTSGLENLDKAHFSRA